MVERALLSESTLGRAEALWRGVAGDTLTRNHGRAESAPGALKLRASDAGRCVRELWAEVHDKRDLPEDAQGMLKMNTGSLVGAWLACLLGAAFEEQDYGAHAEVAMDRDGITGHADLFITRAVEKGAGMRAEPALIVEFKFSAWTGKHDGPKPYHLIQAAQYARMVGAPQFIVIQYYPATQARFDKEIGTKVSEPHIEPSQVYETKDFVSETDAEYVRLRVGLGDEMPLGDPAEAFRCRSCRFAGCERNINPKNPHPAPKVSDHAIA